MLKFVICLTLVATVCVSVEAQSGRIFNGRIATEVEPHYAQLRLSNSVNPNVIFMGSGTLVSRIHVVTAALNIIGLNRWEAGFGSLNFNQLTYYPATGAVVHEDYNVSTTINNIGVIFFGNGVFPPADKNIVPIALPKIGTFAPQIAASGTFAAFGFQMPTGAPSNVLLNAQHVVLSETNCQNIFPFGALVGQFCSIDIETFASPCAGEQGAAFVVQTEDGPLAVGLVSATVGSCDVVSAVTFHIRLSDYRPWLSSRFGI